jgi:hypothetical protein
MSKRKLWGIIIGVVCIAAIVIVVTTGLPTPEDGSDGETPQGGLGVTEITPKALYKDSQLMESLTGKKVRIEGYFRNKDSIFAYFCQYRIAVMEDMETMTEWSFQLRGGRGDMSCDEIEEILEELKFGDTVIIEGTLDGWGDYYGAQLDKEPIITTDKLTKGN